MIISGASGTGKTTALTQLGRTHERHARKRLSRTTGIGCRSSTSPSRRRRRRGCWRWSSPGSSAWTFTGRANITDIVNAVCATAAHTRVELVCVDELHNLNLATRTGAEVSDQLKYFAERLPATFVYAGIDVEARGLFAGTRGRQIAGRFTLIPATPFAYGTTEQREQWRALVATLEATAAPAPPPTGHPGRAWTSTSTSRTAA